MSQISHLGGFGQRFQKWRTTRWAGVEGLAEGSAVRPNFRHRGSVVVGLVRWRVYCVWESLVLLNARVFPDTAVLIWSGLSFYPLALTMQSLFELESGGRR